MGHDLIEGHGIYSNTPEIEYHCDHCGLTLTGEDVDAAGGDPVRRAAVQQVLEDAIVRLHGLQEARDIYLAQAEQRLEEIRTLRRQLHAADARCLDLSQRLEALRVREEEPAPALWEALKESEERGARVLRRAQDAEARNNEQARSISSLLAGREEDQRRIRELEAEVRELVRLSKCRAGALCKCTGGCQYSD